MTVWTLPIELNAVVVTNAENNLGLSTVDRDGLHLSTGYGFYDNISYAQVLDTTPSLFFPLGQALTLIGAVGGDLPTTLTTALFKNINLVAGETLTITYNYNSTEATSAARTTFGETRANDFAFAVLGSPTATTQFGLLARTDIVTGADLTPTSIWSESFQITQNGTYKLLIGNADVRDTTLNSTLTIKSVTITAPDTIAQQTPTGLTFLDGSQLLSNGNAILANGQTVGGFLSAGAQQLLAAGLISQDGGGLVATGGGNAIARAGTGLISQDGGGLISQDGGGLISQDGGGLISQDGGGLFGPNATIVSHDAGGIVSHDAGGIVSHDAGGIVSHDAGGIVSHDAGGLVATGGGNMVQVSTRALLSVDLAPPAIPPVKIGGEIQVGEAAPSFTHQINPVIAALTTGQFVVVWSDDNTSSGHFEVRAQLLNPDGGKAAPSFLVSALTSSDQVTPSVAALADGHFAVSWRGPASGAADLHTQLFDGFGAKVGGDIHVGATGVNETAPHTAALSGGGFVTVFETTIPGVFDSNAGGGRLYAADGSAGAIFGFGSTSDPTTKGGATVTGLQDGGFAIAYRETNAAAGDQDGVYLDIYAADGSQTHAGVHVNTTVTGVQNAPAIATLQNGDIVVSWVDAGDTTTSNGVKPIRGQIFHADGSKVAGEFVIGKTLSGSDAPTITSLSDGRFAITWDATSQTAGAVTGLNLTTQFFTADGALSGTPVIDNPVSPTDAYREQSPAATQLVDGTFAVVGSKTNGGTSTITANLFNVAGTATPPAAAADLKVTTAFLDKTVAGPGDTINLSYQIKNAGTLPAGASTSKIYISDDATITSADHLVGTIVEPGLLAGTSVSDTIDIVIPSDVSRGVHYIGVIADANGQVGESNETNNVSRPVTFGPPASKSGVQFQVDSGTADTHDAAQSHVTALSNGGYVVTWTDADQSSQFTVSSHDVGQVFTAAGVKVGGTFDVEALTGGVSAQDLSVSALAGGKFVAAWSQNDYANSYANYQSQQIHAQIFNADGTRSGSDIVVDPGISGSQTNKYQYQGGAPAVTTLSDGRFLVTYVYEKDYDHTLTLLDDHTARIIEGHIYNADGSSAGPTFQASTSAYLGNPTSAYHPVVAALANGGFVVTYNGSDYVSGTVPAYNGVLAQIYDASAHAVGSEFIVNSQRDYDQDFQDVVGLTNGDFVVTWRDLRGGRETVGAGEDPSYNGVYGQVLTATGERVGGQFLVNTTTLSDQGLSKVAALPDGRFVVTWTDASGASGDFHDDIRAQVFNPDGAKSGTEFLVNSETSGEQSFSSIAALANDDFVVAWNDGYTTYPSHRAIEAQAFTFGTPAPAKPDLTVTAPSLDAHAATAGQTVHLTYSIDNIGPGDAGASTSKIYLSESDHVTSSDRLVATHADTAIASGQSHVVTVDVVLPGDLSYGTYHLAVIADAAHEVAETNEANNATTSSVSVLVSQPVAPPPTGSGTPDLAFFHGANDVTIAKASVVAGATDAIAYYAVNNGAGNAPASHTGIYLSTDAAITTGDTLLTTYDTPILYAYLNGYGSGPNYDYETASFTVPAGVAPGTYYVGAIADFDGRIGESDEANNVSSAVQITVAAPLAIQAPVVFITGSIAGDNVIDASDAAGPVAIAGTASHLDDGSFVTVSVKDAAGHVLGHLSTPVSAGVWSLSLPAGLLTAAANGAYTIEATASNAGGASVASHAVTVALGATTGPATPVATIDPPAETPPAGTAPTPEPTPPVGTGPAEIPPADPVLPVATSPQPTTTSESPVETPISSAPATPVDTTPAGTTPTPEPTRPVETGPAEASPVIPVAASPQPEPVTTIDPPATTLQGKAIDGYLAGALVFADANGNGVRDVGEASATTDANGNFTLVGGVGTLVTKGGVDVSTGLAFAGVLTAPAGSSVVTPLTTVVVALAARGVADPVAAAKAAFGLPSSFDLLRTDPVAASASGDASALTALKAGAAVADTLALISAGLKGAGASASSADTGATAALAGFVAGGGNVDLTSAATVASIAKSSGLSADASSAIGGVAALSNAKIAASVDGSSLAGIQATAQGGAAAAIQAAGSDPTKLAAISPPLNHAPVAVADGQAVALHAFASGAVLANDTDPDSGDTLHVASVRFAGGHDYAVGGGATTIAGEHGVLQIGADGHYVYLGATAGADPFTVTIADNHGATASSALAVTVASAPAASNATFDFTFASASVAYVGGEAILTGPDGVARDVTGVAHLRFADGVIDESDGQPLVDDLFYYAANKDVWAAHMDADQHYAQYGWREGRDPDALFSTKGYLAANPDVKAAGMDPLQHYETYGWHEGRALAVGFSAEAYLAMNPDVKAAGMDPLAHYLGYGQAEGREILPGEVVGPSGHHFFGAFDADFYLAKNADVAAEALARHADPETFAFTHYLEYGAKEGRDPDALFSTSAYLAAHPEVASSGLNPLLHYETYGAKAGLATSGFNTGGYLAANPDVAAAPIDPLQHFIEYGMAEGRGGWVV